MMIVLVTLLIFSFLILSDSLCPPGGYNNSQPQFGPGCMYRCHCVGDVQCDSVTGECSGGCAAAWMGPGCQYGDIAYNKLVRLLSSGSNIFIDGRNATDGLPTTCVGPATWMGVDLNATYRISELLINLSNAVSLQGLEVTVGNASFDSPSDFARTCFKQNSTEHMGITSNVVCTTDIIGRYLLIRIPDNSTKMILCDVRVYGGRSLAYRRDVAQSSTLNTSCCGQTVASRALDGSHNTDFGSGTCTHTNEETSPWWRVNLAVVYNVGRLVLYGRQEPCCVERLSGFSVSFATNSTFRLVFKYPEETPMVITEITALSEDLAQLVEISLKNKIQALTLCEVFVFGDCQTNLCGWTCDTYCYCKGRIDKQNTIYASCPSGCKTGWWGYSCNNTCDTNCKDNTCSQSNGHCFECFLGKWGHFCENDCINCQTGTGCGNSSGICTVGCLIGLYGINCTEHCGHCAGDGSCYRSTGACRHGCQPGWQEEDCTIACSQGWYGLNCSNICGHCANTTCDPINGTCPSGCSEGYNGTNCFERLQEENISTESSSTIGVSVGGALGAVSLSIIIILVAVFLWKRRKRASETFQIESTYDQIDITRVLPHISSEYAKIEELGLSTATKESSYENTLSAEHLIPICEFRDIYQNYVSLDDKTGELRLLSIFKNIGDPDLITTKVTRSRRVDDYIEKSNKTYIFEATSKKESTILSDFPTTSEAFWRIALERKIHLIIIIGENLIQFKSKVQVEIGLIQIECVDIIIERDHVLCNLNITGSEKEAKVRNVQVILSAEESSFWISSDINKTVAVLRKRLRLRKGIEVFNTLINCTPDAKDAECFVATLLVIDFMERSGNIDIIGIMETMRKEKNDAIDTFDRFKFCHDVIFKWIVDEENK